MRKKPVSSKQKELKAQLIEPHLSLHSAVRSPFLFSHSLCLFSANPIATKQKIHQKKKKECIKLRIRIWFSLFPFLSQTVTKFNSRKGFSNLTHLSQTSSLTLQSNPPTHPSFSINILIHSHISSSSPSQERHVPVNELASAQTSTHQNTQFINYFYSYPFQIKAHTLMH